MKSLIVYYENNTLTTRLEDVPIPTPGPHEVLIAVDVAGLNPKDFKHPLPHLYNNALNQGDDCAGTVSAIGSAVKSFQVGERVAGFHVMDSPHGTFAECAICPANTVFRIPEWMSFEEAATIPLAAYTAAVGLYRNLQLPAPWDRSDDGCGLARLPLVVNAGSTAVGAFAIKLAKLNGRIGPIVATAGSSRDFVEGLGVDAVVDYRSPTAAEDIRTALGGAELRHAFDANNSLHSVQTLTSIMHPNARYTCTRAVKADERMGTDDGMGRALQAVPAWYDMTFVGDVHEAPFLGQTEGWVKPGGRLFGGVMSHVFEQALADRTLRGHPFELARGGLNGVLDALIELKKRKWSGNKKFVVRIGET